MHECEGPWNQNYIVKARNMKTVGYNLTQSQEVRLNSVIDG